MLTELDLLRPYFASYVCTGVVESLINCGKQIEAVRFIHAFQLAESFSPVPLLKTYLKDSRRNSQGKGGNPGGGQVHFSSTASINSDLKALNCLLASFFCSG